MDTVIVSFLALLPPAAALLIILWLQRVRSRSRMQSFMRALTASLTVLFICLTTPWPILSIHLRTLVIILFLATIAAASAKSLHLPSRVPGDAAFSPMSIGLIVLLILLNSLTLFRSFDREEVIDLRFPLQGGTYTVMQGGNPITNFFHEMSESSRYAADLVKLNDWGNRAKGLFPRHLNAYEVYGDMLFSPCEGRIVKAVDSYPDLSPNTVDHAHAEGNFVIIACRGANVLLAHLRQGSITVRQDQVVKEGETVGMVGNSGNTFEPHLHIHAETRDGLPVPITFDGRAPMMNAVFRTGG